MKKTDERRGTEQIRTAVGAFAEPSLATRPRYPILNEQIYYNLYILCKLIDFKIRIDQYKEELKIAHGNTYSFYISIYRGRAFTYFHPFLLNFGKLLFHLFYNSHYDFFE